MKRETRAAYQRGIVIIIETEHCWVKGYGWDCSTSRLSQQIFLLYFWLANSTIIQHVAILAVFTEKYVECQWQRSSRLDQHTIVLAHLWSQANKNLHLFTLIPCFCLLYVSGFLQPAESGVCVSFCVMQQIYCHCVKQHRAFIGEAEQGKGRERIRFGILRCREVCLASGANMRLFICLLSSELKYYLSV